MSKLTKASTKRIGRPTKPPRPGERVPLGLRVTPESEEATRRGGHKKGSLASQEAEFRLEMSLSSDRQLILAYGGYWLSVIRSQNDLLVALPMGWDGTDLDEELVPLKIAQDDLKRVRNYFTGAPPPYDMSWRELEQADEEASREIQIAEQEHEARLAKQRRK